MISLSDSSKQSFLRVVNVNFREYIQNMLPPSSITGLLNPNSKFA